MEPRLYKPTWRIRVYGWFFWCLDLVFRKDLALHYRKGPWCAQCRRWWPEEGVPIRQRMLCRCGASDPVAFQEWSDEHKLPPGVGAAIYSGSPWMMLVALAGAAALMGPRVSWWKAFGLEERPESEDEAKRAYRRALADAHPDHGGSREQMEKVRRAWSVAERDYAR